MAVEIARYQFLPWSRKGLASTIIEKDDLGTRQATTKERAEMKLSVALNDSVLIKQFALIGPGDIIGFSRDMIIRTEPQHWINDFEPNYLAFAEFYDED